MFSFSFNGIKKSYIFCDEEKRRNSIFAPVTREILSIPGMPGGYLENTTTNIRVIEQPIFFSSLNNSHKYRLEEDLAAWLLKDKPVPLIFDDDPNRVYFAVVDGSINFEQMLNVSEGVITFICPDPYKYGHEVFSFLDPAEPAIIVNEGTAPTKPIFTFTAIQPTTFIDIIKDDDYMSIGEPVSVEDNSFNPKTRRLYDEMTTTNGWGTSFFQPDGGVKSGTMVIVGDDKEEFGATNYGTGTAWHGPLIQKTFEPCEDYYVRVRFNIRTNNSKQRARNEMYLLGADGSLIGKITAVIRDTTMKTTIEIRLQNGVKAHYPINRINAFKGFFGHVAITKEGTKFKFEIAVEKTKPTGDGFIIMSKETHYYEDLNGDYQLPLVGVAAHVSTWANAPLPHRARIRSVIVDKINKEEGGVPQIIQPGDIVVIDFKEEVILINDEPRTDLKDFGGNYFSLPPGESFLVLNPPDAFNAQVEWRDCYL
ncbi:distal tail protein Dit [Cytobacillus horneckiae]|uniref:distal tail protein Dit n=1 Tax=Cytobacillus horneckiae TaxID=549687 RepID=UPI0039A0E570